jgi:hypothetical protein
MVWSQPSSVCRNVPQKQLSLGAFPPRVFSGTYQIPSCFTKGKISEYLPHRSPSRFPDPTGRPWMFWFTRVKIRLDLHGNNCKCYGYFWIRQATLNSYTKDAGDEQCGFTLQCFSEPNGEQPDFKGKILSSFLCQLNRGKPKTAHSIYADSSYRNINPKQICILRL